MVLVTGAAGHLGNNLVRKLTEAGEKVRAFLMPNEPDMSLRELPVEIVRGDIRKPADVERAVEGTQTVYHLAGIISLSPKKRDLLYDVNVGGTRNVLAACRKYGVDRLVHTASVHAFTDLPRGFAIDETTPFSPDKAIGYYGKSKALAALEVKWAAAQGLDAVIVCPSGVIGPNDFAPSRTGNLIRGLFGRERFVVPTNAVYDFVDVRDVAEGEIAAAKNGKSGEVYLISGHKISLSELVRQSARFEGEEIRTREIPKWLCEIGAFFSTLFSGKNKEPLITRETLEIVESNCDYDNSKTRRALGIAPRPMLETIRDTVEWLLKYYKN